MNRCAFITGITGQDGSYLAELLLAKGYEVHGLVRRSSSFNTERINHIYQDPHESDVKLRLHYGDLSDGNGLTRLLLEIEPDEVYNLAAQSHVRVSFDQPLYTVDIAATGTLRILEAVRMLGRRKDVRFYQASSSEMFGKVQEVPQSETTPFHPRSPYACAKVFAFYQTQNYREAYDLFACNGILFNHESPRRGETFVTRKITRAATRIREGVAQVLRIDPDGRVGVVSSDGLLEAPSAVAARSDGAVYVADLPSLLRINPYTGAQEIVGRRAGSTSPGDIAIAPGGQLVLLDPETNSLLRIDPDAYAPGDPEANQTLLSAGF